MGKGRAPCRATDQSVDVTLTNQTRVHPIVPVIQKTSGCSFYIPGTPSRRASYVNRARKSSVVGHGPTANGGQQGVGSMKAFSIVGLLFATVVLATIPVSPQVTPRGVELTADQAQAVTYRRARVTARRVHRREYRHVRRAVRRGAY
jgi:hypothetical protein